MPTVLFVRISSALAPEELDRRLLERRPRFLDVPGLEQKIYGRLRRACIHRRRDRFRCRREAQRFGQVSVLEIFRDNEKNRALSSTRRLTEQRIEQRTQLLDPLELGALLGDRLE